MSNDLVPLADIEKMADYIAKSNLFGIKKREEALGLMLLAQAEGQHPATVAQDYDIISGRAARKTHSVLSRFQQAGGKVEWIELSDTCAKATFSHPQGGSLTLDWTIERAQKTQVWNTKKDKYEPLSDRPMYKNYPRAMLRARCIAEGVRAVFPNAIGGLLVAEEAQDVDEKDMGDAVVIEQPRAKQKAEHTHEQQRASAGGNPPAEQGAPSATTAPVTKTGAPQGTAAETGPAEAAPAAQPAPDAGPAMNPAQLRIIKAKAKNAGLDIADVEKKWGAVDGWKFADFSGISQWISGKQE